MPTSASPPNTVPVLPFWKRPSAMVEAGALAAVNSDGLQLVRVFGIVREAEITQRVLGVGDALHQHVVVLARGEIAARALRFSDNRLGEVVERARIRAGAVELERPIG